MALATSGVLAVHQHGIDCALVEVVELVTRNRQRLDDANVSLAQLLEQFITQWSVYLHDVGVDEVLSLKYELVIVVAKDQCSQHSAPRRFGDGERAVEREMSRRRREVQAHGASPGVDSGVGVTQRGEATDLDEKRRVEFSHEAPVARMKMRAPSRRPVSR